MNNDTIKALRSKDVEKRKDAIKAIARSADAQMLPVLADVYRNDPNMDVRELARKAGVYIKKQQAASIFEGDPEVDGTPLPSEIVVSATAAERAKTYLSQAFDMEVRGQKSRGIVLLQKALRTDPRLVHDITARTLASSLTGLPEVEAVRQMTHGATVSVKPEPIFNARRIKIVIMMLAGLGMVVSFFLPYIDLFGFAEYTGLEIFQNEDGVGSVLSYSIESAMITMVSGVSPILYTVGAIGAIGALQLLMGLYFLLADDSPRWYWLSAAAMAVFAVVPFLWLYTQLDNLLSFLEFSFYSEEGLPQGIIEFPVNEAIAYGFWLGAACAGLMIFMAAYGLFVSDDDE